MRERLLLAEAEQRAAKYTVEQAERIGVLAAAAQSRAKVARELHAPRDDASAVALLREAIELRLRAGRVARGEAEDARASLDGLPIAAADRACAERVLAIEDAALEALSREELEAMRDSLERVERACARAVESRSVSVIRMTRQLRHAALALLVSFAIFHVAREVITPPNVALHRPVTASAFGYDSATPETLVDGVTEARKAVTTTSGAGSWLAVDLGTNYQVTTVRLVNRQDQNFDAALPFWIELTVDGEHWTPVVKRRDHFRTWTYDVPKDKGAWVRGVRLRCNATCAIGLNELEVRGRPVR